MNTNLQSIFKEKTKIVPFLVGVFCVSTILLMASCGERKKAVSRAEMDLVENKGKTVYVWDIPRQRFTHRPIAVG